jgi:SSS family solute:Na+ symporter
MGTAVGRDLVEQISKKEMNSTTVTRIGIIVMIIFSVTLAYMFDKQPAIIARSTAIFFALCASIFLPSFISGLFWKRVTKAGAIASMLTGFTVSSFWLLFVHFKEAKALGLCKAMFGTNSLIGGKVAFVDALIVALPLSALALVIVSLMTKPTSKDHLKKCFED